MRKEELSPPERRRISRLGNRTLQRMLGRKGRRLRAQIAAYAKHGRPVPEAILTAFRDLPRQTPHQKVSEAQTAALEEPFEDE